MRQYVLERAAVVPTDSGSEEQALDATTEQHDADRGRARKRKGAREPSIPSDRVLRLYLRRRDLVDEPVRTLLREREDALKSHLDELALSLIHI